VTTARRERIGRYQRHEDKARCLLAGLLLRKICGVTDDSQLIYGENGKPYLKNSDTYFNISHSGDYVILATAESEVGVDIEKMDAFSDKVAARCFTPLECEWMKQEGDNKAFYRLWAAKESVMKASGLGFSLPPNSFCVLPVENLSEHQIGGRLWVLDWLIHDGYIICCAVENGTGRAGGVKMIMVKSVEGDALSP
jgi:phosphopantetheinyl transferase